MWTFYITVSKYLNGETFARRIERLEEAIRVLDFKVNDMARPKTNRTMTVGVLIPVVWRIYFTSIVSNVENILIQTDIAPLFQIIEKILI